MKRLIDFFEKINKLKDKKRRGWIIYEIENSESVASHTFRVTLLAYLAAKEMKAKGKEYDLEKVIKMGLAHDLCEVFAKDETPYDPLLPDDISTEENRKKAREILKKWPDFDLEEKQQKQDEKRKRELEALEKLTKELPEALKKEVKNLWKEFEERKTPEGKLVKQSDKVENFLQGIEYWKEYGKIQKDLWIRWAREILDIPFLVDFEKAIERKFAEGEEKTTTKVEKILEFIVASGKLKKKPRSKWILREVSDAEKIAEHVFASSVMSWFFGKEKDLNMEKVLEISLFHELDKVYFEKDTSYRSLFPNLRDTIKEIVTSPKNFFPKLREKILKNLEEKESLSKEEKEKMLIKEYQKRREAFRESTFYLSKEEKEELIKAWENYAKGISKEGAFFRQVDMIANFFQAIQYWREDKEFPIENWWVSIAEFITEENLFEFVEEIHKKYFVGE